MGVSESSGKSLIICGCFLFFIMPRLPLGLGASGLTTPSAEARLLAADALSPSPPSLPPPPPPTRVRKPFITRAVVDRQRRRAVVTALRQKVARPRSHPGPPRAQPACPTNLGLGANARKYQRWAMPSTCPLKQIRFAPGSNVKNDERPGCIFQGKHSTMAALVGRG